MTTTNQSIHAELTAEFKRFKRERTSIEERIAFVNEITERYFEENGEMPAHGVLERLGTLLMQEESSDNKSNKTRTEEFPVLSDNQYRRRTEGRHKGRLSTDGKLQPLTREVPFTLASTVATDGRNYAIPTRRSLDVIEQMDIEYYGKDAEGNDN